MPTETRSLHRKLAQVMYEAERIPKNGVYDGPGRFKFVQVGDAADVIRKALATQKVSMIPSAIELIGETEHETKSGGTMTTMTVRTTWTLTDGDSGETAVIQSMGSGADTGDKAAPKAQSNAMKYALLMGFLLSTGDDPELSDSSDRQRRPQHPTGATDTAAGDSGRAQTPSSVVRAEGGLIGIASIGKSAPVDGVVRTSAKGHDWKCSHGQTQAHRTPEGVNCDEVNVRETEPSVGFVIGEGNDKVQVVAYGLKAEAFALVLPGIVGKRVQVFGPTTDETMRVGRYDKPFLRVHLEKLVTPDETIRFDDDLPAPIAENLGAGSGNNEAETFEERAAFLDETTIDEPPAEIPLFGEKTGSAP